MPNRSKAERNDKIYNLYDDMHGMLQKDIAAQFGISVSAVSMIIMRERKRRQAQKAEATNGH